jgi:peptidoglycan/LPS O-acetylase OafA/YrhL
MPLLFVIAGISTAYALQKRSVREYIRERIAKLMIPLIAGILLIVPPQAYYAERFHNGYSGGYLAQYILFFTKQTDLSGYMGGFTPAHLWFLLYLLVISLVALPLILQDKRLNKKLDFSNLSLIMGISLFVLPVLTSPILEIAGLSVGMYFAFFILGFFVLSSESFQERLETNRIALVTLIVTCIITMFFLRHDAYYQNLPRFVLDTFIGFYAWVTLLMIIGLGRKYLNVDNKLTDYMSRSSFAVYLFHQTWIVIVGYYILQLTDSLPMQIASILALSILCTFATYEACRRLKVTRYLFAIKASES